MRVSAWVPSPPGPMVTLRGSSLQPGCGTSPDPGPGWVHERHGDTPASRGRGGGFTGRRLWVLTGLTLRAAWPRDSQLQSRAWGQHVQAPYSQVLSAHLPAAFKGMVTLGSRPDLGRWVGTRPQRAVQSSQRHCGKKKKCRQHSHWGNRHRFTGVGTLGRRDQEERSLGFSRLLSPLSSRGSVSAIPPHWRMDKAVGQRLPPASCPAVTWAHALCH